MADADLYDRDFYLWTQAQAEALRARGRGDNRLDWDRLAEEIEDMGKSDIREALSRTGTIIEHLFKLAWSAAPEPRAGWRATIRTQRRDLQRLITGSIRNRLEEELEPLHEDVADDVAGLFADLEPETPRDLSQRWSLAQILGEEGDPLG